MEFGKALQTAFEKFKDVLAFLDKVKEKKLRKEKEELIVSIRVFLQVNDHLLAKASEASTAGTEDSDVYLDTADVKAEDDEQTYNDVAVQEENYNDVEVGAADNVSQVYNDTEEPSSPIYDDNEEKPALPPLPPPNAATVIPPTAAEDLTSASTADFLEIKREEKSFIKGAWQKRWCVVQGNVLYMFESSSDKKQKDAIELNGFVVNIRDNVSKEAKRKDRCFELQNCATEKKYEFCATDKDSVLKWKLHLDQSCGAVPTPRKLSVVDNSTVTVSPGRKKGLFSVLKKKNKAKDASDTISHQSDDGLTDYVDTASVTVSGSASNFEQEAVYDDTDAQDVYDDVDRSNEASSVLTPVSGGISRDLPSLPGEAPRGLPPTPGESTRGLPPTPGESTRGLPPTPGESTRGLPPAPGESTRGLPPVSRESFRGLPPAPGESTRGLPPAPGESTRNLPPTSGEPETIGNTNIPNIPSRLNSDKKTLPNVVLPTSPSADVDRHSGSGVFNLKAQLPSIPQEPERFPSTHPNSNNQQMQQSGFLDEEEEYKDTLSSELYQGMWDCQADETNELSFKRGQIVHIISKEYDQFGWWIAKRKDEVGFVPKDYLMEAYEI